MNVNQAGLDLIRSNEGCRLTAYYDIRGILTIGYGHTGPDVLPGDTITQAQANTIFANDVNARFAAPLSHLLQDVPTTDNQFAAMVSLAFNIGMGAIGSSSVLKYHRAQYYAPAADAFLLWDKSHVNGQLVTVAGLARRRGEERALYLTGEPQ